MSELRALMNRHPFKGTVDWIGLRPERLAPLTQPDQAELTLNGLTGDHHTGGGKRAVTLIQAEHLPVIAVLARTTVTPEQLRRNIVVSGINLTALRKVTLQIGSAQIKISGPCPPCSRMERTIGMGGYNAMRGHGGWYAEVVTPGHVALHDAVIPAQT
ncbi:MAG: MOSC domain-containing protein [Litoreibacter sp.]|nr:MOSC domain-containing protein [Litoreibacter sp.]